MESTKAEILANLKDPVYHPLDGLEIGQVVVVLGRKGTIRYLGTTEFSHGNWIGVELVLAVGRNNGSIQGKKYFNCEEKHGMFVRPALINTTKNGEAIPSKFFKKLGITANFSVTDFCKKLEIKLKGSSEGDKKSETSSEQKDSSQVGDKTGSNVLASPSSDNISLPDLKNFAPGGGRNEGSVPASEFNKLLLKLKHVEEARAEDRSNWAKLQEERDEIKRFKAFKPRITAKLASLSKDIEELRKENSKLQNENAELKEESEIDKRMLEQLTQDLDSAQEQILHHEQTISAMHDDREIHGLPTDTSEVKDIEVKGTEFEGLDPKIVKMIHEKDEKIDRLADVLHRYREKAFNTERILRQEIKLLEEKLSVQKDYKSEIATLKSQLLEAQNNNRLYEDRLEDLSGAKEIIESLNQKNIELRDQVDELTEENDKITTDLEVNSDLLDGIKKERVELLDEIDRQNMTIQELLDMSESLQEELADKTLHLEEFRQYIDTLNEDINEMQEKLANKDTESVTLKSQTEKMLGLNLNLQSMVLKSQSKTVELELRKMEAEEASTHLKCIMPYLPESFFLKENDSLKVFLQLKRIHFKAELCGNHLCSPHQIKSVEALIGPSNNETMIINERVTMNFDFRYRLNKLLVGIGSFIGFLKSCSVAQFLSFSRLSQDFSNIEGMIDVILEEIQSENLSPSTRMAELDKMIISVNDLCEAHINFKESHPLVGGYRSFEMLNSIIAGHDLFLSKATLVYRALTNPNELDLFAQISNDEKTAINSELLRPLTEIIKMYHNLKLTTKLIQRGVNMKDGDSIIFDSSTQAIIDQHYYQHDRLIINSSQISSFLIDFIKEVSANDQPVTFDGIKGVIANAHVDSDFEFDSESLFSAQNKYTDTLISTFKTINSGISDKKCLTNVETLNPWVSRAQELKKELIANDAMEKKLNDLNNDLKVLYKDNRVKDELVTESNLKVEYLEVKIKRMQEKLDETARTSEELIQNKAQQDKLYDEEIQRLYLENHKLEVELAKFNGVPNDTMTKEKHGISSNDNNLPLDSIITIPKPSALSTQNESSMKDKYLNLAFKASSLTRDMSFWKTSYFSQELQFNPLDVQEHVLSSYSSQTLDDDLTKVSYEADNLIKELDNVLINPIIPAFTPELFKSSDATLAQSTLLNTYAHLAKNIDELSITTHNRLTRPIQ